MVLSSKNEYRHSETNPGNGQRSWRRPNDRDERLKLMSLAFAADLASHRKPIILSIFAITYVGIAVGRVPGLKLNRVGIALLGAIAMMIFGGIGTADAISYINWPTIFLLFGFFVISAQLRLSGFYDKVANGIAVRLGHPAKFLLVLMVVVAGLSAVLNHDIVCFVFAPIIAAALLQRQLNPIPFLIALAISSNIGAAATIIGNPQDMMIAEVARLDFGPLLALVRCPRCGRARFWLRHHLVNVAETSSSGPARPG